MFCALANTDAGVLSVFMHFIIPFSKTTIIHSKKLATASACYMTPWLSKSALKYSARGICICMVAIMRAWCLFWFLWDAFMFCLKGGVLGVSLFPTICNQARSLP
ncbi:hypothetical protein DUNSADRAFT_11373 [Dunaliella salina]|uniref:Encoded protein n=1 Tax=Dunaliella salina TaxID=3046 RepID=A0ABQ7GDI4_DUNSA|nr:hypothetical protein DUNSADRAFT_11373 [Dunaliella salina]|eukprot:KAF5832665.1 hypothetical protein DUNSADRAFT_11373 [Dunaliella salina]